MGVDPYTALAKYTFRAVPPNSAAFSAALAPCTIFWNVFHTTECEQVWQSTD
jgi:hypothetical protein